MANRNIFALGWNRILGGMSLFMVVIFCMAENAYAQSSDGPDSAKGLPVPAGAIPLNPSERIWIDKQRMRLLLDGEVCLQKGMLELLICPWNGKLHESIVRVHSKPSTIHAGLLAIGGVPGSPVSFDNNEYKAAHGGVIEIIIQWKDENGKLQEAHGQDWVRHRDRRADRKNLEEAEIIDRGEKSLQDQVVHLGEVESFWVPVHPAFKERLKHENDRHVLRPSATGKQIEQLMVLSDPKALDSDRPEPETFYRTQFSPAKTDNPEHQILIELSDDQEGDQIRVDGRLRARWEPVFPNQKDAIASDKKNVIRPSSEGKQIEELVIRGVPLEHDWIFAGSHIMADPRSGEDFYVADRSGEIVCVSNFPTAMIDLPVESSSDNSNLGFEAASENIPAKGTKVRIMLVPHRFEEETKSED
jgi:hypothetical protein